MRFQQRLMIFCFVCLGVLMLVYKQMPSDRRNVIDIQHSSQVLGPRIGRENKIRFRVENTGRDMESLIEKLVQKEVVKQLASKKLKESEDLNKRLSHKLSAIEYDVRLQKHELHIHKDLQEQQEKQKQQQQQKQQKQQKQTQHEHQNQQQNKEVNESMLTTHKRVLNKLTKDEITEFYNRERISQMNYGAKTLDLTRDRELLMALFPGPRERRDRVTDQLRANLNVSTVKTIYVRSSSVNSQRKFDGDNCNVKLCRFTNNAAESKTADAVYSEGSMPASFFKKRTNKKQVLVAFQLESSRNYPKIGEKGMNWTASYRRDSVLNTPYERFTPFLNVTKLPSKPKQNYAKGKTKMAAWFVSNCGGSNRRMNYVKELQKYISIDIYGRCGTLHCIKSDRKCFESLNTDYKFYLAFENSNCKDYATEKLFWNGFLNNIIPIVMGAHPEEYKQISPPNSYIHVDEFASPKQLAEYLTFLDKNDDLYSQYFFWKGTGRFVNTKFMCRLCTMVHLAPLFPMWYSDTNKWWLDKDTCLAPTNHAGVSYASWNGQPMASNYANYVKYGYNRTI